MSLTDVSPPEPLPHPVDVSVIVPVLDEEAHLDEVLGGILRQTFPGTLEILLIDGGSQDRSRAIIAELAARDERFHLLENPHRLIPQALNIGLARAHGRYVVRMDAHTHYPTDYIELGVARLEAGDDVTHVSGPQIAIGTSPGSNRSALALASRLGVGGASFRFADHPDEFEVDSGFTGIWRRATLLDANGWDETFPTDEDCELAFRLRRTGGREVCVPAMAANYVPRDTLRGLGRQYYHYGRVKVRTFRRHPDAMHLFHLLPPLTTLTVAAAAVAPRPLRRLARAGTGAYVAALLAGSVAARRHGSVAAGLPAVWATMHLAYGVGMLVGVRREGLPWRAVAGAARASR